MNYTAVLYALGAAVLFGLSTPAAKLLIAATDPFVLAGILYLGAGGGLAAVRLIIGRRRVADEAGLSLRDLPWLGAAIFSGGVIGPVLLMIGLQATEASSASLLLTLEGVATAVLAWVVFGENVDRRIAIGMGCIGAGAMMLSWRAGITLSGLAGPLAIMGACLAWAIDNNLTRKVSLSDPMQIAMVKGLVAGPVSLALGLAQGAPLPSGQMIAAGGVTGFLGYGVSLALFVAALRHLGSARTAAYFSTAPLIGAAVAIALLGDPLSAQLAGATVLMGIGLWLHLSERHVHEHSHEELAHAHRHVHDQHHRHAHDEDAPQGEPHSHWHVHAPLRHRHPHTPDSHHRHSH